MKKTWILPTMALGGLAAAIGLSYRLRSVGRRPTANPDSGAQAICRIVSLAPNLTEILFALGLGERVVAVSSDSNFPAEVASQRKVGTFWQPNTEAIVAARPDLVVTLSFEQHRAAADSLQRLGYRVLSVRIETVEELLAAIRQLGQAAGCVSQADTLAAMIQQRLSEVQARANGIAPENRIKVLWVVQTEPLRVAGRDTFPSRLIEMAGGQNAIDRTVQQYPPIGAETLLSCAPQVILQPAMAGNNLARQRGDAVSFWSRWPNLPAVKNGRIYVIPPDTVSRLGPRLPDGLELVCRCLHPERFAARNGSE
jgi:iron complex transport system substrate-binding protein